MRSKLTEIKATVVLAQQNTTLQCVKTLAWGGDSREGLAGETHQKSAEFLVADSFPWTGIHAIGCHNGEVAKQVQDLVNTQTHRPAVTVEPTWYY